MIRYLLLGSVALAAVAAQQVPQQPPQQPPQQATPLVLRVYGRTPDFVSRDAQRLYYVRDSGGVFQLRMFDRRTRADTLLMPAGPLMDPDVSPAGDRLAFIKADEDATGRHVWTVALNPSTGLPTGAQRRVSVTDALEPTFSPDGRWIAFYSGPPTGGNIVLVAANGGPERILARTSGWAWPLRWTPDGTMLYYGVNTQTAAEVRQSGIYRVPVSGGTPQQVAVTDSWGGAPGLSPDGRHLIYWTSNWATLVAQTTDGRAVVRFNLPADRFAPVWWMVGQRALDRRRFTPASVAVRQFGGGRVVLADSGDYLAPVWSADGRRVAYAADGKAEVTIVNADGAGSRTIRTQHLATLSFPIAFSPDGRSMMYGKLGNDDELYVINLATSRESRVAMTTNSPFDPRWLSDSRGVLHAVPGTEQAADTTRLVTVHESGMDGASRIAGTVRVTCPGVSSFVVESRVQTSYTCDAKFVSDSHVVTWTTGGREYRLRNFRQRDTGRVLFTRTRAGPQPAPSFSTNGRWMAVRDRVPSGEVRIVHVVGLDGSSRRTLTLPFDVAAGSHNPSISSDGRSLVVAERQPGQQDSLRLHRVDVATGRSEPLMHVPRLRTALGLGVSPDGRSIASLSNLTEYTELREVDATPWLPRSGGR